MKAEREPVPDWNDASRASIKDLADVAVERIFRFLVKGKTYVLSIKPDPVNSGKIWSICLNDGVNDLNIALVEEGSYLSAVKVVKYISMMLQVFGYDINDFSSEDFVYTPEEKAFCSTFEKLKISVHLQVSISSSTAFNSFFYGCKVQEEDLTIAEIGGMSYNSAHILCLQICLLLSALGKQVICPDGSTMNQYGVAEISPDNPQYKKIDSCNWMKATNSIQHISLSRKILERIDLPTVSTKHIDLLPSSKYVLHSTSSGSRIYDTTSTDETMPYKPLKIAMTTLEREAYNDLEAERIIGDAIRHFISVFGLIRMRVQVAKRSFISSGKTCLGIVIEDLPV